MTHFVWTDYIRMQYAWAERLKALADERTNGEADILLGKADEALANASRVMGQSLAGPLGKT